MKSHINGDVHGSLKVRWATIVEKREANDGMTVQIPNFTISHNYCLGELKLTDIQCHLSIFGLTLKFVDSLIHEIQNDG